MKTMSMAGRIFVGLGLLVIAGMSVLAVKAYRAPLGAALTQDTPTAAPPVGSTDVPTALPAQGQQSSVCGESEAWNILVLGSDGGDLRGQKGADLTRILRVDFPNRKVTIFAFPRDLWVDTTGLGLTNPAIEAARLGTVFYEARLRSPNTAAKDTMLDATSASAQALLHNFSVSTDHYLAIDLTGVPAMVDVVDGIPIDIPQAITDPWIGMVIPAGQQTLNGAQFIAYARVVPDSDFGRIQRNNLLVDALRQKLLDPGVWTSIPELYAQFDETIATDLSPEQISHLSCLLKEVPAEAIVQDQVRQEWTSAGPQPGSLAWDKTLIVNRLQELGLVP
jgi:LCP family protein required for cell wall assembly